MKIPVTMEETIVKYAPIDLDPLFVWARNSETAETEKGSKWPFCSHGTWSGRDLKCIRWPQSGRHD